MGCAISSNSSAAAASNSVSPLSGTKILRISPDSKYYEGIANGECVKTETFAVGGHRWYIEYYPNGRAPKDTGWLSVFLFHLQRRPGEVVSTQLKISLLDRRGEPVPAYSSRGGRWRCCEFSGNQGPWGYPQLVRPKDLLRDKSRHVSAEDGVLSVRFDIAVSKESPCPKQSLVVGGATVPPPDIVQDLARLLSSGEGADVTFEVGGETFAAHRHMLAARSSVFKAELLGPMRESASSACVRIEDVEPRVFEALLRFIYTDSLPSDEMTDDQHDVTGSMIQHLLVAADRYDLKRLKLICEEKLCACLSSSTVATTLALAEQHGCCALKEACFCFLESHTNCEAITRSADFEHLARSCPSIMKELIPRLAPKPPVGITYNTM